jgi:hypothetical protein
MDVRNCPSRECSAALAQADFCAVAMPSRRGRGRVMRRHAMPAVSNEVDGKLWTDPLCRAPCECNSLRPRARRHHEGRRVRGAPARRRRPAAPGPGSWQERRRLRTLTRLATGMARPPRGTVWCDQESNRRQLVPRALSGPIMHSGSTERARPAAPVRCTGASAIRPASRRSTWAAPGARPAGAGAVRGDLTRAATRRTSRPSETQRGRSGPKGPSGARSAQHCAAQPGPPGLEGSSARRGPAEPPGGTRPRQSWV